MLDLFSADHTPQVFLALMLGLTRTRRVSDRLYRPLKFIVYFITSNIFISESINLFLFGLCLSNTSTLLVHLDVFRLDNFPSIY